MRLINAFLVSAAIIGICVPVRASESVITARQLRSTAGSVSVYYTHITETLSLQVKGTDAIAVGNNQYFSAVTNDLSTDVTSDRMAVRWSFQPTPEVDYWLKAGSVNYELSYPSTTVRNTLSSDDRGVVVGFGIRKLLMPDTLVTPAIAVELGGEYLTCGLSRFAQGGAASVIADRIIQTEVQAAVTLSKKYAAAEPYGGMRVTRTGLSLRSNVATGSVDGTTDLVSLFAGCKVPLAGADGLIIEASFVGQRTFSVGWHIEF